MCAQFNDFNHLKLKSYMIWRGDVDVPGCGGAVFCYHTGISIYIGVL